MDCDWLWGQGLFLKRNANGAFFISVRDCQLNAFVTKVSAVTSSFFSSIFFFRGRLQGDSRAHRRTGRFYTNSCWYLGLSVVTVKGTNNTLK